MTRNMEITFHPNTLVENASILQKLRSRKIDHKSASEWKKLFTKLNNLSESRATKKLKLIKQANVTARNNSVDYPIYGPIEGFPSGSWWGIRMDCSRDEVHTPFDNDIEEGSYGVASICTSHINTNNDVDLGTLLTVTGEHYIDQQSRMHNDPLMYNYKNHIPIRLVRSYNLANDFAPKTGYRYDGLYLVASFWIGVCSNLKKYYKYALVKLNYQEPPIRNILTRASTRVLTRLSSALQNNTSRTSCGSSKDYLDDFQVQNCEKSQKKIRMERSRSVNLIRSNNNFNCSILEGSKEKKESTIVMRHVSKKYDATSPCQLNSMQYSPNPPSTDLQNMNISIRTELYDSSPNPTEDLRKSTPMTFYKVQRTDSKMLKHNIRTSTPDAINLNTFGPDKDNLRQESQIQLRYSIAKESPILNSNAKETSIFSSSAKESPILSSSAIELQILSSNDKISPILSSSANESPILNSSAKEHQFNTNNTTNVNNDHRVSPNERLNDASDKQPIGNEKHSIDNENSSELPNGTDVNNQNINSKLNSGTKKPEIKVSSELSSKKNNLPEAFVELESMTPEQMLNLIMKKRFNPTGTLLMGSIIGLPTNDSCLVNINGSLKLIERNNGDNSLNKSLMEITSVDATNNMREKSRGNKLYEPRPKTAPPMKIDHRKNERVKSTGVRKRTELDKLTIDAIFTPIISGETMQTRNMTGRRLREASINSNKKKELPGSVTNNVSKDLTKKIKGSIPKKSPHLTKMKKKLRSKVKDATNKSEFLTANSQNNRITRSNNNNNNNDNYSNSNNNSHFCYSGNVNINSNSCNNNNNSSNISKNENRNLKSRQSKIHPVKMTADKAVGESIVMIDVSTQCSLTRDASTSVNNLERQSFNQKNSLVKAEWINDGDDVKTESNECDNQSLPTMFYRDNQVQASEDAEDSRNSVINRQLYMNYIAEDEGYLKYSNDCGSAFVPVNLSDQDLRVVKLRSIGFKPIETCEITDNSCYSNYYTTTSVKGSVLEREVNEQYDKYTSEENSVVGYMDNELHYQDIEAEDIVEEEMEMIEEEEEEEEQEEVEEEEEMEIEELDIDEEKEKIILESSFSSIYRNEGITAKRKRSSSAEDNGDAADDDEDEEKLPWFGWDNLVNTNR